MDIPRGKEVKRRKMIQRIVLAVVGLVALAGTTFALMRLKPAAPSVDSGTLFRGPVQRGPMDRNVHGIGRLTPEEIVFLPAPVDSRIVKINHRAGETVRANDVIMVMSNPDIELEAEKAQWTERSEAAKLSDLRVTLESTKLDQRATLAQLESDYTQAKLTADRDLELTRLGLKSDLESRLSVDKAEQLAKRLALQKQRLEISDDSIKAQIAEEEVAVEKAKADYEVQRRHADDLNIRANVDGVVQEVPVEVGQRVPAGTILAKVAQPTKLKAELKIAETQMRDIQLGQEASIDTRNGLIPGRVIRIDPAAQNGVVLVDVKLDGPLPPGSRPELSVDGTIELERLSDVVFVQRPVFAQQGQTASVFKVDPDGKGATQVKVKFGRASTNAIEVVEGLKPGDNVILSDMTQWDSQPRIRLN
jgi:HlyD family secretion protein